MTILTPTPPPVLAAGDLTLDTGAKVLGGPEGSTALPVGTFPLLKVLMERPGVVVSLERLIGACWPDADLEPEDAAKAVRKRIRRCRDAMEVVGVPRDRLKLAFCEGYRLVGSPMVARTFTPAVAAKVDAFLAGQFAPEMRGAA